MQTCDYPEYIGLEVPNPPILHLLLYFAIDSLLLLPDELRLKHTRRQS